MTPQIQNWVKNVKKDFVKSPGRVLEIGSYDFNGSIRQFFDDATEYIGTDMIKGPGVDRVVNAHNLLRVFKPRSFDVVVCCETLEHDNQFWITINILHKLVKKEGFLIISTPTFGFPLHRYPKDYFRYGEDAYREIFFTGFDILRLSTIKDSENNPGICCVGIKRKSFLKEPRNA